VNLIDQEGNPNPRGHQTLVNIFYRRLDRKLIQSEALEMLVEASGGLIGTLVRLGGLAAEHALVDGKEAIDRESADQAIAELRGDFKALLRREDYQVLRRQMAGEELMNEEAVREVLYTGCLLEYHDHEPWFAVHPIVRPLLEERDR